MCFRLQLWAVYWGMDFASMGREGLHEMIVIGCALCVGVWELYYVSLQVFYFAFGRAFMFGPCRTCFLACDGYAFIVTCGRDNNPLLYCDVLRI